MELLIISPEKTLFKGETSMVTVPGKKGEFTILKNHAPIISTLSKGIVTYQEGEHEKKCIGINAGLIEVNKNIITICVEETAPCAV